MVAKLIDGKKLAQEIRRALTQRVKTLTQHGHKPGLAVILVGEDPASQVYVRNKIRACEEVGITSFEHRLTSQTTEAELLELIEKLNQDDTVDGILVQLPVPRHIRAEKVIAAISPDKDVDGFHAVNAGRLLVGKHGREGFVPCTPAGIMRMIDETGIDPEGKNALVIGRSNIVGKPAALLLLERNATVTIAHSRTKNLKDLARQADILVAAVGRPRMITRDMVKPGAVVIDVGINRDENNKLCGDVDTQEVREIAGAISPVPGGVGPMTIAMLLENTVRAAENRRS